MTHAPVNPYTWKRNRNPNKLRLIDQFAAGSRVLDIGCGPGFYASHLHNKGFHITAIDMEDRHETPPPYSFQCASVPPLAFPDATFDTVLMFDILEHIPDESLMLKEVRRVITKRLILSVPSDNDGELPTYGLCLSHHVDKTHQREYSSERLQHVLRTHGFRVLHIEPQFPQRLPLVVTRFFRNNLLGSILQTITTLWIKVCMKAGLIRVDLPADWLVVAEPMNMTQESTSCAE